MGAGAPGPVHRPAPPQLLASPCLARCDSRAFDSPCVCAEAGGVSPGNPEGEVGMCGFVSMVQVAPGRRVERPAHSCLYVGELANNRIGVLHRETLHELGHIGLGERRMVISTGPTTSAWARTETSPRDESRRREAHPEVPAVWGGVPWLRHRSHGGRIVPAGVRLADWCSRGPRWRIQPSIRKPRSAWRRRQQADVVRLT